ncbi:ABC transporter permease subunit, partial [Paenibacillus zanthoxyli]|uniref:ABC transporter permease subunit n=1 Tax=Paenibacillus zanthoxyli TaxID=369399 RepID=UPI00046F2BAE
MNAKKAQGFITQNAIYLVLVVLILGIAVYEPSFMSVNTLRDILIQSSTRVIIALGVAFILITAGTDLSAGRVVGLTAVISASMLQIPDYSRRFFPDLPQMWLIVPIVIAILAGLLCGLINGLIVSRLNVPPFIATLGTMVMVYGINSLYF